MQIAQKNFYKKLLGHAGEVKACEYLKEKGYKILEKNYKTHFGEVDIIAKDTDITVFVEVKTRTDDSMGSPAEAVNFKKQNKIITVAKEYLIKKGLSDGQSRFDVIEIENGQTNHIIDAFCC